VGIGREYRTWSYVHKFEEGEGVLSQKAITGGTWVEIRRGATTKLTVELVAALLARESPGKGGNYREKGNWGDCKLRHS